MATEVAAAAELKFGRPAEDQAIQTWRPPPYYPPCPVAINPAFSSSDFKDRMNKWLIELKVDTIFSSEIFNMLIDMECSKLAD
jgi:hypothetical protein